jgi:glycosyltransferase involved in cell wall biosynthesis
MVTSTARQSQPLLSAVVPFLNKAATLPQLIASLEKHLGGLGIPWELVLVDDGSRDESLAIARREFRPSQA